MQTMQTMRSMPAMGHHPAEGIGRLAEGIDRFRREVFPAKAGLFARLATTHQPRTLFIGCSDARVVPELVTQQDPGELFVIRTAGNLVPAHAPGPDGVAAGIEYAVAVLGVTDIVVCGHSACGAMTALAEGHDLTGTPALAAWLHHADASRARATTTEGEEGISALVRENVAAQLANLATHPSVARALAEGTVRLHGWVFDIPTGTVAALDTADRQDPAA
ncbi:Carbonic anhydrase [Streptomyces lydicus]|nr:Carbonic anhydrase [Streptomyces lydicus]